MTEIRRNAFYEMNVMKMLDEIETETRNQFEAETRNHLESETRNQSESETSTELETSTSSSSIPSLFCLYFAEYASSTYSL